MSAAIAIGMINQPTTFESIDTHELVTATGGGIGQQIGSMFGEKGAKWGGIADSILGMFGGMGGGGGGAAGGGGGAAPGGAASGGMGG